MGSDAESLVYLDAKENFNPRSPHGERRRVEKFVDLCMISIHAPRMGSDIVHHKRHLNPEFQSTLPAWGATREGITPETRYIFQSTLPAWGATAGYKAICAMVDNFNPRSPHGERPERLLDERQSIVISIHAPRMGSDMVCKEA